MRRSREKAADGASLAEPGKWGSVEAEGDLGAAGPAAPAARPGNYPRDAARGVAREISDHPFVQRPQQLRFYDQASIAGARRRGSAAKTVLFRFWPTSSSPDRSRLSLVLLLRPKTRWSSSRPQVKLDGLDRGPSIGRIQDNAPWRPCLDASPVRPLQ